MDFTHLFAQLEATSLAQAISQSTWLFPTIETVHVLFLTLVVGTIMIVDLRLLNIASRNRPVSELTAEVLPWTWTAFVIAAISGGLLFSSAATKYIGLWPFRAKMVMLALAAINMAVFHLGAYRGVAAWDRAPATPPPAARLAGGISLAIWVTVVGMGRWIGFM
ncbi:MAG TPA: DUF6644 family protein [Steroidobacteraceae bacterium]|nr:DUF6644 family protein [Steroidobacteraceae bacterium]